MATNRLTIFVGGVADANNYTRGNGYKITQINMGRRNVNEVTTLEFTVEGSDKATDTRLVKKSKVFVHTGTAKTTSDKLWHKFYVTNVKWKSDKTAVVSAKTSAHGGTHGLYDGYDGAGDNNRGDFNSAYYAGDAQEILDSQSNGFIILGEGGTDEIGAIDTSGTTDKPTRFKIPPGTKNKLQAVKNYADYMGYEFQIEYSTTSTANDTDTLVISDRLGTGGSSQFDFKTRNPSKNCTYVEIEEDEVAGIVELTGHVEYWGKLRSTMKISTDVYSNLSSSLDTIMLGCHDESTGTDYIDMLSFITGDAGGGNYDYIYVSDDPTTCSIIDPNEPGTDVGNAIIRIGNEYILISEFKAIAGGNDITTPPVIAPNARGYLKIWKRGVNRWGNFQDGTPSPAISKERFHPKGSEILNYGRYVATPDTTKDNQIVVSLDSSVGFVVGGGTYLFIGDEGFYYNDTISTNDIYAQTRGSSNTVETSLADDIVYAHFKDTRVVSSASGTGPADSNFITYQKSYTGQDLAHRDYLDKHLQDIYDEISSPQLVKVQPSNAAAFMASCDVGDRVSVTDVGTDLDGSEQLRFISYTLNWSRGGNYEMDVKLVANTIKSQGYENLNQSDDVLTRLLGLKRTSELTQNMEDLKGKVWKTLVNGGEEVLTYGWKLAFGNEDDDENTGTSVGLYREDDDLYLTDPNTNNGTPVKLSNLSSWTDDSGDLAPVSIYNGDSVRIYDGSRAESIEFYHDGSKGIIACSSATALWLSGSGNDVVVPTGADFYVYGAGDVNYIKLSHDNTDGTITVAGDLVIVATDYIKTQETLRLLEDGTPANYNDVFTNGSASLELDLQNGSGYVVFNNGTGTTTIDASDGLLIRSGGAGDITILSDDDLLLSGDSDVRVRSSEGVNDYVWLFDSQGYLSMPTLASDPADTPTGGMYYNSGDDKVYVCDGTDWNALDYEA